MFKWLFNLAACFSQFLNCFFFNGWPDETISGRCHRENIYIWEKIINTLFFFQIDHCRKSHEADVEFANMILKNKKITDDKGGA